MALQRPVAGSSSWNLALNSNFAALDAVLKVLYVGDGTPFASIGDIGAQINAAYASIPSPGSGSPISGNVTTICVVAPADNSDLNFSTPILFGTLGKYATLDLGGNVLNYIPTTATAAITLDYSNAAGSDLTPAHGIRNGMLLNNGIWATGGGGSSAIGIAIGNGNGGAYGATLRELAVCGFGTGFRCTNVATVGLTFINCIFTADTLAFYMGNINGTHIVGGEINGVGKIWQQAPSSSSETYLASVQIFNNGAYFDYSDASNSSNKSILHADECHFESFNAADPFFFKGYVNLILAKGLMEDDYATGTGTKMIDFSGDYLVIDAVQVTAARVLTQIVLMNSGHGHTRFILLSTNVSTVAGGAAAAQLTQRNLNLTGSGGPATETIEGGLVIGGSVGFYGHAVAAKPAISGSRGGNAALADLLTKLAGLGLLTDSSS